MSQELYDLIVVGAGPGGYISAIRAAQLGMKVACIDRWKNPADQPVLGGTCLNVGCIPSKALLSSSERFEDANLHFGLHGIHCGSLSIDVPAMIARKDSIIHKMTQGIAFLFRKNKITWVPGHARFLESDASGFRLGVFPERDSKDRSHLLCAKNVVIATGSVPRVLPKVQIDNRWICDNEGALNFEAIPKRLGVIGAGVIGLELGSVWRRLGAEVTVLESSKNFLGATDIRVQKEAKKLFSKQGLLLNMGVHLHSVEREKDVVHVIWSNESGEKQQSDFDRVIVSIGRVPNTDNLGLDSIGITLGERGVIPVDEFCQTEVPGVWAIGDVVRGPMLAHKAEDEGVMVSERIAGQKTHICYENIPWVIYTSPEIAWVGKTEQQLKEDGRSYRVGEFSFAANGRALSMAAPDGFVKIISDAKTDEVLGVHIIGANASDLISEAVLAIEFKASAEDIARICHPHPSLSEVVREAAMAASGQGALNA